MAKIYKFSWDIECPFCKDFGQQTEDKWFAYGLLGEHIVKKHKGRLKKINLKCNSKGEEIS